jgi:cytochrome P450
MSGRSQLMKLLAWGVSLTIVVVGTSILVYRRETRKLPPINKHGMIKTTQAAMDGSLPYLVLECTREMGPIFRLSLPTLSPVTIICDPVLARQLLETDANKSHGYEKFKELTFNHPNIISKDTVNGGWEWARKAVSPSFSNTNLYKTLPKLHDRLHELLIEFDRFCSSRERFDMGEIMLTFTFNFIATSMFGVDYKLDLSPDSHSEASVFLHELHLLIVDAFRNKTLRIDRLWNGEPARAALANQRLRQLTQGIVDNYRQSHSKEATETDTSIMGHLIRSPYETDEARCADMIIFMIAGHDTTAYTIAWTLIELSRNPQYMTPIRAELDRINPDGDFEVPHLSQMDYLLAVIRESMRLNPVVALGSGRRYDHDLVLGDYIIPKESSVIFPFMPIFRSGIEVSRD